MRYERVTTTRDDVYARHATEEDVVVAGAEPLVRWLPQHQGSDVSVVVVTAGARPELQVAVAEHAQARAWWTQLLA